MVSGPFRHIFLKDAATASSYTGPKRPVVRSIPARNRAQHAEKLRQELQKAWAAAQAQADARNAVSLPVRDGTYLVFSGAPGADLAIGSLEDMRAGIRLLSVRSEEATQATVATVYVPKGQEKVFLNKIRRYAEEETKKGNPKNQPLINSIEDIQLAILQSFWLDEKDLLPKDNSRWCEVWLRDDGPDTEKRFRALCDELGIECETGAIHFPERAVLVVLANAKNLTDLMESSDNIAEYRLAKETARFFLELENADQTAWVKDLLKRLRVSNTSGVTVCVLDTGANNGHPLLQPILSDEACQSYIQEWKSSDHNGHGTLMCGLAAYGDLQRVLETSSPVPVDHALESVKILPPSGQNDPKLYGHIVSRSISMAEVESPEAQRIICMAVSATDTRDRGRPSSWSSALDAISSGYEDDQKRLIIVAAGNVSGIQEWILYPDSNLTNSIHDPGQAWNAVTAGAFTEKTSLRDPTFAGYTPIATAGALSPFSTTSLSWENKWPIKPEVLFEGGNAARSADGTFASQADDLSLVSTCYEPTRRQFDSMRMTSAAVAQAARLAARIQVAYPNAWPETVRALLVHSAKWTEAMVDQFISTGSKAEYSRLLRICGYGVPDERRAIECAANHLTLVAQEEIRPFICGTDGLPRTNEMHLYQLPWPREVLLALGEVEVTLRVTLSYFVEPGPGEIGWRDRYRYASHALRFEVNSAGESQDAFTKRLNVAAREEGEKAESDSATSRWLIGSKGRNVGSIHSDIWRGSAADVAACNMIGVYPIIGWWRERSYLGRCDRRTRYSLVVSVSTPLETVDLYTPIAIKLDIPVFG